MTRARSTNENGHGRTTGAGLRCIGVSATCASGCRKKFVSLNARACAATGRSLQPAAARESREIAAYDLIAMPSGHTLKPAPPCEDGDKRCGGFRTAPGSAIGRHTTIPQLAALLSGRAGRRVTDATGVQGNFDVELRWNPGPAQLVPAKPRAGPADAPPIDPSAPTLSVAIEEQLGLRFRSSKGTTEYLTIASIERAREN
jgi:uncharacterized protein (TIGR03435 family)